MKAKKQQTTEESYTVVTPVVFCSDSAQIDRLMNACGVVRAVTYNKLGSLQGWNLNWMFAAPQIKAILPPESVGMSKCRKIWEWSVNDCMKAIAAQQEAASSAIIREIWQKLPMQINQQKRIAWLSEKENKKLHEQALILFPKCEIELSRERLLNLLYTNPTEYNWLHRRVRKHFQRGHTFKRNQIVYQGAGYKCQRVNRHSVVLTVMGEDARQKITLKLRSRQIIKGQIRLIRNEQGALEVHWTRTRTIILTTQSKLPVLIGLDKGYTEGFYTSDGIQVAPGLGKLMSDKTNRITAKNRNRYRIRAFSESLKKHDAVKAARILKNNLGYQVKSTKLQNEKNTIKNFIRRDLRQVITTNVELFCEDLSSPIKSKATTKSANRKLNQWMKGELQASVDKIALETGSKVTLVNCAYTSQMCSLTGTLLGFRKGDRFTCHTGVVLQADLNAAINIRNRGTDYEIQRFMKSEAVLVVLLNRTIRYLVSIGKSISDALELGWLNPKFKAKALKLETIYHSQG